MIQDNRILVMKGLLSDPNDADAAYRELASHYNKSIGEVKAETKTQGKRIMPIDGLVKVVRLFGCKIEIDFAMDKFKINYHEKESVPVELKPNETKATTGTEEKWTEIGNKSSDLDGIDDDEGDLF